MTRYRLKTRRAIAIVLEQEGPSSLSKIADCLNKEPRVIRNYLKYYSEAFEVTGLGVKARWRLKEGVGSSSL